jgi:hypothetical protein
MSPRKETSTALITYPYTWNAARNKLNSCSRHCESTWSLPSRSTAALACSKKAARHDDNLSASSINAHQILLTSSMLKLHRLYAPQIASWLITSRQLRVGSRKRCNRSTEDHHHFVRTRYSTSKSTAKAGLHAYPSAIELQTRDHPYKAQLTCLPL